MNVLQHMYMHNIGHKESLGATATFLKFRENDKKNLYQLYLRFEDHKA